MTLHFMTVECVRYTCTCLDSVKLEERQDRGVQLIEWQSPLKSVLMPAVWSQCEQPERKHKRVTIGTSSSYNISHKYYCNRNDN